MVEHFYTYPTVVELPPELDPRRAAAFIDKPAELPSWHRSDRAQPEPIVPPSERAGRRG